jgi:hypothetical protein
VGVDPDPGSTIVIPHNEGVDVRAPMSLARMQQIVKDEVLSMDQLQILGDRIRELAQIHDGTFRKRTREQSDSDSERPRKRRADHDLKYNTIEELKLGASLKQWTNWKMEITRAFVAAPYKYDNDHTKVIKALMHLHKDCKIMWNNHIRLCPDDEYVWEKFLTWIGNTIRDHGNFEMNTNYEWTKARQGTDQTPWAFDAYLSSFEVELEPATERTRAMNFLSRLQPQLRKAIHMSGVNPLPQTRQEMVSLATRMWEGLKEAKSSSSDKPTLRNTHSTSSSYRGKKGRATENTDQKGSSKTGKRPHRTNGKSYPKEFASGRNEKGERICYRCGSNKHLAPDHDKKEADDTKTAEPKKEVPTVKTIKMSGRKKGHDRTSERMWELSDSESYSGNE